MRHDLPRTWGKRLAADAYGLPYTGMIDANGGSLRLAGDSIKLKYKSHTRDCLTVDAVGCHETDIKKYFL